MNCVFDIETTSLNVFEAEIIEGHFIAFDDFFNVVDTFELKCRPQKWAHEAEQVHGIKKEVADTYRPFKECYVELLEWFVDLGVKNIWQHTNAIMYGKLSYYDFAVLRLQILDVDYTSYFALHKLTPYSTHSLVKIIQDRFNFESFRLDSVCKVLGIELNHHNAKSDTEATFEIIKKLLPLTTIDTVYSYERGLNDTDPTCRDNKKVSRRKKGPNNIL